MQRRVKVERDPELKIEITQLNEANPDWSGKNIRAALEKNIRFENRVPSTRTIQNVVKKNTERKARLAEQAKNASYRLNDLWHLSTLNNNEYSIPADAIPLILEIKRNMYEYITIRQAQWLARLYKVVSGSYFLCWWSQLYAAREQIFEIAGLPFNSADLDSALSDSLMSKPLSSEFLFSVITTFYLKDLFHRPDKPWGKSIAHGMEEELIGHEISNPDLRDEASWRLYECLLPFVANRTGTDGSWAKFSDQRKETVLRRLREKIPEFLESITNQDMDLFWKLFLQLFKQEE
jgi:hypothetical protein